MFELYAMQLSKTHGAECPIYVLLNWNRAMFNGTGNFCERRRREPLGGVGACPHRKFSNLKALKRNFQHSQADSCVKKVSKIDCYFLLSFDKKSVAISCIVFLQLIITVIPSYQGPKYTQCTFIFCSFTLREFTVISNYLAGKNIGH